MDNKYSASQIKESISNALCTHINENNARNSINMDIESIHEEETELDITNTNRLLYANMGSRDKTVTGVIRRNDFSS